jgi:formylglycine-generating enzyme required for sulfatase activity
MVAMALLAVLLGVGLVYQSDKSMNELKAAFENQLAALNNKQNQKAGELSEQITKKADDLSEQITNKANELSEQITKVDHRLTAADNKQTQRADDLFNQLTFVTNNINWLIPGKVVRDRLKDGGYGPEMVVIPAGTFRMGDTQGSEREKPVHEVSIKRFAMGRYEVTFAEYDKFANATGRKKPNDRGWGRGNRPVINVSWHDAVAYTEWLSEQTGEEYRLPSEAEWEYAARAGTKTKYCWGNEIGKNRANCNDCGSQWDKKKTAPVGSFKANPFGLHDTVGNVWEWVADLWHDNYKGAPTDGSVWEGGNDIRRVLRGGSWGNVSYDAARRGNHNPSGRNYNIGFRVVRRVARFF